MTLRNSNTYDNLLLLKDAGAVTATGVATVAAVPRVLDLGPAAMQAKVVIDPSAIDFTSLDETYRVTLQGCNAIGFGAGVVELGSILVGSAVRHNLYFINRLGTTVYQFVRLNTTVGGTTPSINFTAFIAKE